MTALTKDTPITEAAGDHADYPIATGVKVYDGAAVGLNSVGYARGFVLGDQFRGHALEGKDNTGGANGAIKVKCKRGRYYLQVTLANVAITDAVLSVPVYMVDDGTFSLREGQMVGRVVAYVAANTAIVELDTEIKVQVLAETFALANFTDGGAASGYVDFATQLPKGAVVVGWQADVQTAFAGPTASKIEVGAAGNTNQFSAKTDNSVSSVAVVGSGPLAVSADPAYLAAATTARVTVTDADGTPDFGNFTAGEVDVKLMYITSLRA